MNPRFALAVFATAPLLLACQQEHQYLAIPGARVVAGSHNYTYDEVAVGSVKPSHTVIQGSPALSFGESVTIAVDFSAVVEVEVATLLFIGLDTGDTRFRGHWQWPLTLEEIAAGVAEVEIHALNERPTNEWCQRDYRGVGTCYQESDEGVTGLGLAAAGGEQASPHSVIPIDIPGPNSVPDSCSYFTVEHCCAGGGGIGIEACWVDPNLQPGCGCPDGTRTDGVQDGLLRCVCPGY